MTARRHNPLPEKAANALRELLVRHDHRVLMRYDIERRDDYGRWLAHLDLPDKTSVTAHLLRLGLATHLAVPPDIYSLDCYRRAEVQARAADMGIWRLPEYQIVASTEIEPETRGFRRVRGTVTHVGHSRLSVWLNLEGGVALRIDREDTEYFPYRDSTFLKEKQVTARGWLYECNGELRMQIHHPAALEIAR